MSVADFMATVLNHPHYGYYAARDPLGSGGDFITAPEVSQMFGELIGLWCVQSWLDMGMPDPFILAELGPGRGTLMADLLRAARIQPRFLSAARVHLVDTNTVLRERQRHTLKDVHIEWHGTFAHIPDGPLLLIANEFFDCLPIRQFVRTPQGWCERSVGLNEQGVLAFMISPNPLSSDTPIPDPLRAAGNGSLVEICPAGLTLIQEITARLHDSPGRILIIDYGHEQSSVGETLQAVKDHQYHDVLSDPGEADVTAHVDFGALSLAAHAQGAVASGPATQGQFLKALGIDLRAESLAKNTSAGQKKSIALAQQRLTAPDQMGKLFKVLAVSSPGLPKPAGFEAAERAR